MTLLDDFKQFVNDAQSGTQYYNWVRDNSGLSAADKKQNPLPPPQPGTDVAKWYAFRDAITAGQRPSPPTMATPHGRELIDAGVEYLDATAPAPPPPPPPVSGPKYLSSTSPWNTPIGDAATHLLSSAWVNALYNAIGGINVNQGSWTPPVFYTNGSEIRKTLQLDIDQKDGKHWIIDNIPIPNPFGAEAEADGHAVVIDAPNGLAYDFYRLRRDASGNWTASACVPIRLNGSGWWDGRSGYWGTRASSASLIGGLILAADVKSGVIPHALSAAAPKGLIYGPYQFASPATSGDGSGPSSAMPMGTRFQLDPAIDLNTLGLESGELMIAKALQTYGVYITDSSSAFALYCENFKYLPGGANPYPASWSNGITKELVKHFRVVVPPAVPIYDSLTTFGQPHK